MTPEARFRARARLYLTAALQPPAYFSAIEHARRFEGDPDARMRQAAWWKGQGVKPGLADVFVWGPDLFAGIELKVKGNKPTPAEIAFGDAMKANGHHWFPAWSVVEIDAELRRIGFDIPRSMQIAAMEHDAALSQPEPPKAARRARNWNWTGEEVAAASRERLQEFLDEPGE